MSRLFSPRNVAIGGIGAGLVLYYWPKGKGVETYGTQNIANRFSSGGATHTHTPAVATPRGKADHVTSPQTNPTGIDSKHFIENVADQKTNRAEGPEKVLNKTAYGHEQGK